MSGKEIDLRFKTVHSLLHITETILQTLKICLHSVLHTFNQRLQFRFCRFNKRFTYFELENTGQAAQFEFVLEMRLQQVENQ